MSTAATLERPAVALPAPLPPTLYHYTCVHGGAGIDQDRVILPRRHPLFGAVLVWLTDLYPADRYALGLTSNWIKCDRTRVRCTVAPDANADPIVPWGWWAHHHRIPRPVRDLLEDRALPAHWWVSAAPVPVLTVHIPQGPHHDD